MPRRTISRVPAVRGPRRKTTWGSINSLDYTMVAAGAGVLLASFTASGLANIGPSTLIRVRGSFAVKSDQAAAIELSMGVLSVAVVTQAALDVGASVLNRPVLDGASDSYQAYWPFFVPPGPAGSGDQLYWQNVDSKGMRKLGDLDGIAVMVDNANQTDGLIIAIQLRFLFLLH